MSPYFALRIDVETAPGLLIGLPSLLATLKTRGLKATIMVPTGPDRSGLALTRVLKSPWRIRQMLRLRPGGRAAVMSFLAGIAVPVRSMAPYLRASRLAVAGHDVALHGHDHWAWIHRCRDWPASRTDLEVRRGVASFARALGFLPHGFGAPGWVVTDASLWAVDAGGFRYAADCRGTAPFVPEGMQTPQLPTTLPTLEEILRQSGAAGDLWPRLDRLGECPYACYCAHAEIEGMRAPDFLSRLLDRVQGTVAVGPLSEAPALAGPLPACRIEPTRVAGRFDPVAGQVPVCESS